MAVFFYPPADADLLTHQADYLDHQADPEWSITEPRGNVVEVDFTTEEGTWMSVDISPDGTWLVFDLLGHIYRLPATGGKAKCLTQDSGIALNFHPRISPDGQSIAFVSDRKGQNNLWLMGANGENPRIVFEDPVSRITSPSWMPDGKEIVAVREFPTYSMHRRSARIWAFPIDQPSRNPRQLVGQPSGKQAYWPAASANGKYLYYMYSTFAEPLHGLQRYQHIRRIELDSGQDEAVTLPEGKIWYKADSPTEMAPELSPDGHWLAFARRIDGAMLTYRGHQMRGRTALWIRNLGTGKERLLADPITYDMQHAHGMKNLRVLPGYAWDAESRSIIYSQGGGLRRVWLEDGRVETIPFSARVRRTASQQARATVKLSDDPFESKFIRWPDVTNDGRFAVFEAVGWIWRKNLPDGAPELLLPTSSPLNDQRQFMPDISPDGRDVVFVSWDEYELGQLWRAPLKGGKARRVTRTAAKYLYPSWSLDGKSITVLRSFGVGAQGIAGGELVHYDLVSIGLDSKQTLLQANAAPYVVHHGPDGRLFQLEPRDTADVQTFLAEGKTPPDDHSVMVSIDPQNSADRVEHLRFPAASEAAPSPGGDWVAFREDYEIYLTHLRHDIAVYQIGQPLVWSGPELPFEIIKEDARQNVARLSEGGGIYLRWLDDHTLVYASANRIYVYDANTGQQRVINVGLYLNQQVPEQTIALVNARIVTLEELGVIEQGTLVVDGARIVCVGECDTSAAHRVLNLAGKTIIPGFVDVHAHGGYDSVEYPIISQQLPSTSLYLAYGVTTTLDPAALSETVFPVAEMVRSGRLPGPRILSAGDILMPESPQTGPANYLEAERMVSRLAQQGAVSIKIFLTPRRDQRQMYAEAARRLGLSVTNEGADFTYNVGSMLDGNTGFEHLIHQVPTWNDVAQIFAQTKAVYSPTLIVAGASTWMEDYFQSRSDLWNNQKMRHFLPWQILTRLINHTTRPKSEYTFPAMAETVADLIHAGGRAAIGGHGQVWGLDSHWEVWGYAEALDPLETLDMASMGGAYMAGLEKDIGSIKAGKLADLIILDANPLEDIHKTTEIKYVMKGGVLYDDETLDEIWPNRVKRPKPAWYREDVYRSDSRSIEQ